MKDTHFVHRSFQTREHRQRFLNRSEIKLLTAGPTHQDVVGVEHENLQKDWNWCCLVPASNGNVLKEANTETNINLPYDLTIP